MSGDATGGLRLPTQEAFKKNTMGHLLRPFQRHFCFGEEAGLNDTLRLYELLILPAGLGVEDYVSHCTIRGCLLPTGSKDIPVADSLRTQS